MGFFGYDKRAHMQVDGKAVTLQKRVALSGSRYSGGGVTLRVTKSGTTLQDRQAAGDDLPADVNLPADMKKGRNLVVSTLFYLAYGA